MKLFNIFFVAIVCFSSVLTVPVNHPAKNGKKQNEDYETKHINIINKYSAESTVLLRRNKDFPLKANEKKISLFGNGIRKTIKGGTGSGDVYSRTFENVEEAFISNGYKILTKDFLDEYDKVYEEAHHKFLEEINSKYDNPIMSMLENMGAKMDEPEYNIPYAKKGDVAIYVLSRISGEGTDRAVKKGDVLLTDTEVKMINTLAKGYKKFMLVLNTGGPVDLSPLKSVKNILVLSQLGVVTSQTLVDIVSGKKYPSGKLTTTWTKYEDYSKIGDFGDKDDTYYKEGIYVGYRYFDSADVDVMFPFGFGLGYTDFKYTVESAKLKGEEFRVDVSVKNTGKFNGKEVMQLYLSKPGKTLDEPYQILVQFDKTKELAPKKSDTLRLKFKLSDFASYDTATASYILEAGTYIVRVGNSSRNTTICGQIVIKSKIVVKKLQNKLGNPGFKDVTLHSKKKDSKAKLASVPKFTLKASSIHTFTQSYNKTYTVSDEVKALTKEQKASLVVGAFGVTEGSSSIVGAAAYTVAGAAGQSAMVADLRPIIMADGPAGLRLAKDYYIDETGAHTTDGPFAALIDVLTDEFKEMISFMNPQIPEGTTIYHQYATAIPIGTALAQSWNREFATVCGDIVGTEMEIFKVQLWLAPALNIHRSILCGRNFEYYSEDPFISGIITAAITNGVQKHKNAFVTMKHYAANNQEYNRYYSNSHVSERAMREIYLKGFEIAIKESKPKAVMTSYNLVNGVHTNESKELTNDILRNEFDFDGIVMTDWMSGFPDNQKYAIPYANNVIKATGDIYMPGSQGDYDNILKALEDNKLSMEELELSAARIYDLAKEIEN
ncbi:beta-glucosidase-related glycosidase [Piromyces finnis]|uniref:beta-glucosidase n=1 Tax=Piromyces finnis TaxID=1754191 RepID=A0A1Y1UW11_9FUNG|nr:beta-glucosidase-related glycosidase [Piromyces finnis]|eukprot:ORX42215.1 beta-glucosidase-related glycosidase [Piromyces finnis]